jgi:cell shape-determining protein MreC
MLEARVEELQTKLNQLTADNKVLKESLLVTFGLAQEYAPKEMLQVVLDSLIKNVIHLLIPDTH